FHLAQVLASQGEYLAALQRVDEYLQTQPQGTEAYQLRIDILRNLKRDKEILPFLRDSADRDPNNETLKLFLANEYKRSGNHREAEALFVQIAERSPSPDVYHDLVDLWKQDGREGLERILTLLEEKLSGGAKKDEMPLDMAQGRALLLALRDDGALLEQLM